MVYDLGESGGFDCFLCMELFSNSCLVDVNNSRMSNRGGEIVQLGNL